MEKRFVFLLILGIIAVGPVQNMISKPESCGLCCPSIMTMSNQEPNLNTNENHQSSLSKDWDQDSLNEEKSKEAKSEQLHRVGLKFYLVEEESQTPRKPK